MLKIYDYLDEILAIRQIGQASRHIALRYYASDLMQRLGAADDPQSRSEAVYRTMKICHAAGIPLDKNFRRVYVYSGSTMESDWMLSSLASFLFLLNGDPEEPFVAKAQLSMILKMKDAIAQAP